MSSKINFDLIKNKKLRQLVEKSSVFQKYPMALKEVFLRMFLNLSYKQESELLCFFNGKTESSDNQFFAGFYGDFLKFKSDFNKYSKKDFEHQDKKTDKDKMNKLLNELFNT